ncbi:SDR family oxidoreductase [Phenylobacterium sp.]|uniref:SDR family oxidoreductase n=1 Tax=Phenylobacterium sp. TaxID=1871053 RepID=UPI00198957E7|nr:SDR family oxidoreductase [Phenylobacterium sp.]MBC7168957.1 SDR family oxidoreductase [Phenylobacterium sp.]
MLKATDHAAPERRRFKGRVAVVTGASAGVGRATALALGREGARVGLIARNAQALEAVAGQIRAAGGEALALPLDVADAAAVEAAAEQVESRFGPLDLWVNAAMVTVFSPVSELEPDEVRRVTEVTYLGSVHGVLAALRRMRRRGRGTIVQVGSALAFRGIPLQSPYCAAKHAIRGFVSSLRAELKHERSRIRLTEVHLPGVNTPQFGWARTKIPQQPRPVGQPCRPEVAADAILHAARHPNRDWWLGSATAQTVLGQAVAPALMDRIMAAKAWEGQFTGQPGEARPGNLFETVAEGHAVSGPFAAEAKGEAMLTEGPITRMAAVAAGALGFMLLGALLARR